MKTYSLKVKRLKTGHESVKTSNSLQDLLTLKDVYIARLKTDTRSKDESFQIVLKQHNDAAFNYDIISTETVN